MRRLSLCALLGLLFAGSGAVCWNPGITKNPVPAALRGFSSGEELRAFLVDQVKAPQSGSWDGGGMVFPLLGLLPRGGMVGAPSPSLATAEDGDDTSQAAPTGGGSYEEDPFSTTNIQETGVDESDVVKNDGQTIYVLDDDRIHIVQATPPEGVAELATVQLESPGDSLYLRNGKLVALSQSGYYWLWAYSSDDGSAGGDLVGDEWNDGMQTTVTVINVSDPANPAVEATVEFEGSLATSRLIQNHLHLVLTSQPRLAPTPLPVEDMTLEEWLPDYEVKDGEGGVVSSGDIVGWDGFYRPEEPNGYTITTVVTLDIDNPTGEFASTAITADTGVIYASTEALYITDTDYAWTSYTARETTAVHKLAFTDTGTQYVGSGSVSGRPLNQYSLGEYEGYLRIATTISGSGWGTNGSTSSVYVLGEGQDAKLNVVGSVENIAPDEQIYSARFLGPRGFLVTFKKIDPLFTMDLSDPTKPAVVGELKVPGYSDHIQLMDENHLLTIGKDADDVGDFAWYQGVQLSIFDVSDLADPKLVDKEIIGARGTESEANYNPKAFNYFAPLNALAFPIDVYAGETHGGPEYGQHVFSGLYVYQVTVADGFKFLGGIPSVEVSANDYWWGYWSSFGRGVFIGDTVYSVTDNHVKAAALDDVSTIVGEVVWEQPETPGGGVSDGEEPVVAVPSSASGGIQ